MSNLFYYSSLLKFTHTDKTPVPPRTDSPAVDAIEQRMQELRKEFLRTHQPSHGGSQAGGAGQGQGPRQPQHVTQHPTTTPGAARTASPLPAVNRSEEHPVTILGPRTASPLPPVAGGNRPEGQQGSSAAEVGVQEVRKEQGEREGGGQQEHHPHPLTAPGSSTPPPPQPVSSGSELQGGSVDLGQGEKGQGETVAPRDNTPAKAPVPTPPQREGGGGAAVPPVSGGTVGPDNTSAQASELSPLQKEGEGKDSEAAPPPVPSVSSASEEGSTGPVVSTSVDASSCTLPSL